MDQQNCDNALYCPFEQALNPSVELVQSRSLDWCSRKHIVSEERRSHLAKSKIAWLTARAFPQANIKGLQLASDWTHLFCLLDDRTDRLTCPVSLGAFLNDMLTVFRTGVLFGDMLTDPFAHALLDLRSRMLQLSSAAWLESFANELRQLFIGYSWETINDTMGIVPDLGTYLNMRARTIGLYPQFLLAAITDDIELPAEVLHDPIVRSLMTATSNCVAWANDLCTYEKEIAEGENHNLVAVMMKHESMSMADAANHVVAMHDAEIRRFLELESELPIFAGHDRDLTRFVGILRSWIRGHLDWAQETGRYRPGLEVSPQQASESGLWARAASW
ncbi:MAG: hypothetical protein KC431_02875 [Myxococcales bacterium]|nr:hypothetical protein [Myxococcales bacterium]